MRTLLISSFIALALMVAPSWADETTAQDASGMTVEYDQSVERLFDATLHAMDVLNLAVERRDADALRANVIARRGVGSARALVGIVRIDDTSCKVTVDTTDHDAALPPLLHEKIAAALR